MTQYRTLNPLGSMAPKDLYDNAQNIDNWSNGDEPFYENRFGELSRSFSGMNFEFDAAQVGRGVAFDTSQADRESRFQAFLVSSGYVSKGDYAANVVLEERNEYVAVDAATTGTAAGLYRPNASATLPLTLTGTWATDLANLVLLGDDVLRQELAGQSGASMIGRGVVAVSSIADLAEQQRRADLRYTLKGYHPDSNVGGGEFYWDETKPKSEHNGGTVVDPDAVFPSDWSNPVQQRDWFSYTATGQGVFVRVIEAPSALGLSHFGAKEGENIFYPMRSAISASSDVVNDLGSSFLDLPSGESSLSPPAGGVRFFGVGRESCTLELRSDLFVMLNDCEYLIVHGMSVFSTSTPRAVLAGRDESDAFLLNLLDVYDNSFTGSVRIIDWSDTSNADPFVSPFGIISLKVHDNLTIDCNATMIRVTNLPVKEELVYNNIRRNCTMKFHESGITNENPNAATLMSYRELAHYYGNSWINDDDIFIASGGGSYSGFFLTEADLCIYENNHFEGVKSPVGLLTTVYDLYGSSNNLVHRNNTYKNNCPLDSAQTDRQLVKCKDGAGVKEYYGNSYIIDSDIHTRWGVSESLITHRMFDVPREGSLVIRDNFFSLKHVVGSGGSAACESFTLTGNDIRAEKVESFLENLRPSVANYNFEVFGNKVLYGEYTGSTGRGFSILDLAASDLDVPFQNFSGSVSFEGNFMDGSRSLGPVYIGYLAGSTGYSKGKIHSAKNTVINYASNTFNATTKGLGDYFKLTGGGSPRIIGGFRDIDNLQIELTAAASPAYLGDFTDLGESTTNADMVVLTLSISSARYVGDMTCVCYMYKNSGTGVKTSRVRTSAGWVDLVSSGSTANLAPAYKVDKHSQGSGLPLLRFYPSSFSVGLLNAENTFINLSSKAVSIAQSSMPALG